MDFTETKSCIDRRTTKSPRPNQSIGSHHLAASWLPDLVILGQFGWTRVDYAGRAQALKKHHSHRNCQRAPETLLEGSKGFQGLGMFWNVLECFGMFWNVLECFGMFWNITLYHFFIALDISMCYILYSIFSCMYCLASGLGVQLRFRLRALATDPLILVQCWLFKSAL